MTEMRIHKYIYTNTQDAFPALILNRKTHLQMGAICQPDDVVLPAPRRKEKE